MFDTVFNNLIIFWCTTLHIKTSTREQYIDV